MLQRRATNRVNPPQSSSLSELQNSPPTSKDTPDDLENDLDLYLVQQVVSSVKMTRRFTEMHTWHCYVTKLIPLQNCVICLHVMKLLDFPPFPSFVNVALWTLYYVLRGEHLGQGWSTFSFPRPSSAHPLVVTPLLFCRAALVYPSSAVQSFDGSRFSLACGCRYSYHYISSMLHSSSRFTQPPGKGCCFPRMIDRNDRIFPFLLLQLASVSLAEISNLCVVEIQLCWVSPHPFGSVAQLLQC